MDHRFNFDLQQFIYNRTVFRTSYSRTGLNLLVNYNHEFGHARGVWQEDQLKLAQFHSILELETRIACAHKEIARKRYEVLHFKRLLTKTINERDDFLFKYHLLSKNLSLQHENEKFEGNASFVRATDTSYIEYGPINKLVSSSTQKANQISLHSESQASHSQPAPHVIDNVVLTKRLPEKGRFLQAMIDAGPLLQTLLLQTKIIPSSLDLGLGFVHKLQNNSANRSFFDSYSYAPAPLAIIITTTKGMKAALY
ncbi:hypothetical protein L1987_62158 [Smallanthus sonchifolius]|uniref:Uncharacterized protein n=1 Tax=Smallanthus sonchifolius TaxID=185202 RepID=A0ACB9C9N6_9ASTR|nr:hypothetical protein L1987_62158 [Smallanthus sonchifolius]